ncbi:DUF6892 domain-containing protein [Pseudochryseolinea flava]|uniref:DUF3471 domain-containing protein n=1 Tax=Pseudochryseolinea flava TaxID=2059302 RepID=A0A364Y686_9BACT|nr:hypothetical protein [Pseudochryseolinea flava]RAW02352.1 hypothetical protein DQQ10_07410 [Pseudochryseolinea flava]
MQTTLDITLTRDEILINKNAVKLPTSINILTDILGPARLSKKKYNQIYTWDALGLLAYSKNGKIVEGINIPIVSNTYDFSPTQNFSGTLTIDGHDYRKLPIVKEKKRDRHFKIELGAHSVFISLTDEDSSRDIDITAFTPPPPVEDPDRYKFKKAEGEKMAFVDFNFKLCVVQELMYMRDILKPRFDVYEFVERYKERQIDIEEEGYDIIPEVRAYFDKLEIDNKYADIITTIEQDGGNDIYMHIFPFWTGETDDFNIQVFTDVDQFKNLKSMTLFYDKNEKAIQQELKAKDIEVS